MVFCILCLYCLAHCLVFNTRVFRPPGTLVPEGLIFYPWCFFIFSPRDLRAPSADRRETLPHDRNLDALYNASPRIRGAIPVEIRAQNMQNLGQFHTTSDFDFSGTGQILSKIGKRIDRERFLPRSTKKSGELSSTKYRVLNVSLDPPKLHFWETIFRPLGGAGPSNFNTHYRLVSAHP